MIGQVVHLSSWYLLGLVVSLLAFDRLPAVFLCCSAFFWGVLFWSAAWLVALHIPFGATRLTAAIIILLVLLLLSLRRIRRGVSRPRFQDVVVGASVLGLVACVAWFSAVLRLAAGSFDSVALIRLGESILERGFSPWALYRLGHRGVMAAMLHGTVAYTGGGCLYGLQPVMAVSFVLTFCWLSFRVLLHVCGGRSVALVLSLAGCAVLFSSRLMMLQCFFVHDNLIAAAFFFIGAACIWLSFSEDNNGWLAPASWAMVAFSLTRLEGPLYALIPLTVGCSELGYNKRLKLALPAVIAGVVWNAGQLVGRQSESWALLSENWLAALLVVLCGFGLLQLFSFVDTVERAVIRHLRELLLLSLAGFLLLAFMMKPAAMTRSVLVIGRNIFPPLSIWQSWWGLTWVFIAAAYVLSLGLGRFRQEWVMSTVIVSFLLLTLLVSYGRNPYRFGWGDSGNRMMTHIAPIAVLYVFARYAGAVAEIMGSRRPAATSGSTR